EEGDERKAAIAWARASESAKLRNAMMVLARSELAIVPESLDRDAWSLNCLNGTLDLRTGRLRPHDRGDFLTKLAPVEYRPVAQCPLWESTLRTVFGGNESIIGFWQRLCGLALTGDTSEQILPVLHGGGSNGKSTILGALMGILGNDYAMKAMPDL